MSGCDRQSDAPAQESAEVAGAEEAPPGEIIDSGEGMTGRLDISGRGNPMINASFQAPDGRWVTLSDFKGKPLLVNIWATWCGPCVIEMPMLDQIAGEQAERLKVLVVSQDMQGAAKVEPFFAKAKFAHLEPYLDPDMALSLGFGEGLMPTTVLYDAQGKEVWRLIGAMDWTSARAAALMEETLSGFRAPA
jgi:thiol-disulfide isomerase/thioredoxin